MSNVDPSDPGSGVSEYERALRIFAEGLKALHIDYDAPPFRAISERAQAAGRVNLSVSAISEALNGKRLPSIDFTIELVRQICDGDATLVEEWRENWKSTKRAQRSATTSRGSTGSTSASDASAQVDNESSYLRELQLQRQQLESAIEGLRIELNAAQMAISEAHEESARIIRSAQEEAVRIRNRTDSRLLKMREHAAELMQAADEALERSNSESNSTIIGLQRKESLRIVLAGPPGAGKGTQAAFLAHYLRIPHVSVGDLFRRNIEQGTSLGKIVKRRIEAGKLVEDEVTLGMLKERIQEPDVERGFLLDGIPRTLRQAEALQNVIEFDSVLDIEIPEAEILLRLTNRRICRNDSSHVYHLVYKPSRAGKDICDLCGGEIYLRADDVEETIKKRIEVYNLMTAPVVDHYRELGLVSTISGLGKVPEITGRAIDVLAQAGVR